MQVGMVSKRHVFKNVLVVLGCIGIGWFIKARLTPPMPMMGMGGGEPFVLVMPAAEEDVSVYREYVGAIEAPKSADLVPQISGYVEKAAFAGGSRVAAGQVLFVIERERYEAEFKRAEAAYIRADKEYKRQVSLRKQNYASEAQLDNAYTDLMAAQANFDLAKINLGYTEVKAPFSGVIGKALVTEGNLVSPGGQVLARVVQDNPIRVAFSVSDKDFLDLRELFHSGGDRLRLKLILPNGEVAEEKVLSYFASNEVNPATATAAVYAIVDNSRGTLTPGNFVQVWIDDAVEKRSVVVSQAALGQDADGMFAYVVSPEGIAEQRRLKLGEATGDGRQIVLEGIRPGERVIVQGLQRVADGKKVKAALVDGE